MTKNIPEKLFRYRKSDKRELGDLFEHKTWISSIEGLNDLFDCTLRATLSKCSVVDLVEWLVNQAKKNNLSEVEWNQISRLINDNCRDTLSRLIEKNVLEQIRKVQRVPRGVCCFSETNDNKLMWAHYAGGTSGICLEFDTRKCTTFDRVRKVTYSDDVPRLALSQFNDEETGANEIISLLATKCSEWKYEREWRLLFESENCHLDYAPDSLSAIYIGARAGDEVVEKISSFFSGSSTKIYRMITNEESYGLYFELVE